MCVRDSRAEGDELPSLADGEDECDVLWDRTLLLSGGRGGLAARPTLPLDTKCGEEDESRDVFPTNWEIAEEVRERLSVVRVCEGAPS